MPTDAVDVPSGGGVALGLVEAAGRSLRIGDRESAALQVRLARTLWPAAPGLARAELAVRAAEGESDPDVLERAGDGPGAAGAS
jgi:hypothetical protein